MPSHGKPARLDGTLWAYGDRVTVLDTHPPLPHAGEVGTVRRVRLDGGEIVLTVEFDDGERADYWDSELCRVTPDPM